jgi:hypothetical protein
MNRFLVAAGLMFCLAAASCSGGYLKAYTPSTATLTTATHTTATHTTATHTTTTHTTTNHTTVTQTTAPTTAINQTSSTAPVKASLNCSVIMNDTATQFTLAVLDDIWSGTMIFLNSVYFYNAGDLHKGIYTIGLSQFARPDGTHFNPVTTKPLSIEITVGQSGYYRKDFM